MHLIVFTNTHGGWTDTSCSGWVGGWVGMSQLFAIIWNTNDLILTLQVSNTNAGTPPRHAESIPTNIICFSPGRNNLHLVNMISSVPDRFHLFVFIPIPICRDQGSAPGAKLCDRKTKPIWWISMQGLRSRPSCTKQPKSTAVCLCLIDHLVKWSPSHWS